MKEILIATIIATLMLSVYRWHIMRTSLFWGRWFLWSVPFVSVIAPILPWSRWFQGISSRVEAPVILLDVINASESFVQDESTVLNLFLMLWFGGVLVYLLFFLYRCKRTVNRVNKHVQDKRGDVYIVSIPRAAFAFMGKVYLHRDILDQQPHIVSHEKAHVVQGHMYDLLFGHLCNAIFWWHPLVWLYRRLLNAHTEFLADEAALQSGVTVSNYQQSLLNQAFDTQQFAMYHSFFNMYSLKNRCIMMSVENRKRPIKAMGFTILVSLSVAVLPACVKDAEKPKSTKSINVATDNAATKAKIATYPQFRGGQEAFVSYMQEEIVYPKSKRATGETVKVFVAFTINKEGAVENTYVKNADKVDIAFQQAAIAAIEQMPDWEPGVTESGDIVPFEMELPVVFSMDK